MHRGQDKLPYKKKIPIKSLEAAICNVAVFKSMKDKQFKDTIYISYCEEGVILEAISEGEWKRAYEFIRCFLDNKKISQLTYGFEKEEYEELINRGLKQYTRSYKDKSEQCPYINIIHFQKLRKSCEYMDKQRYKQPLKDWQRKNKRNPNFVFLIVEPKHKFDEVKRSLLEFLLGKQVPLNIIYLDPINFMYLLFICPIKEKVREAQQKKLIEISIKQKNKQKSFEVINFTELDLDEYEYSIVEGGKNINKWGLQYISAKQLREQMKNSKLYCRQNPTTFLQTFDTQLKQVHKQNYNIIPYKKKQQQKYKQLIHKFSIVPHTKGQVMRKLEKYVIWHLSDIDFISQLYSTNLYTAHKVCIHHCPYMMHQYRMCDVDIDAFFIYVQQLSLYYCTYLVRYYGISLKYSGTEIVSIYLIFDYHKSTLQHLQQNDMIIDNLQVATMMIQVLYVIRFLHQHQQPRCLGSVRLKQIYWPMAVVLPYLGATEHQNGLDHDILNLGQLMKTLLDGDDEFKPLLESMLRPNKYDRASTTLCIEKFEELLCL